MRRVRQHALFLAVIFLVSVSPARAAQSFVYVTQTGCASGPGCTVVAIEAYDATTGRLAARIPMPPNRYAGRMAISPDGRRLYVNLTLDTFQGLEIAVIDMTRHQFLGTHPVAGVGTLSGTVLTPVERIAVSRDGSRVFHSSGSVIRGYDSTTFAQVVTITAAANVSDLAASPTTDRLYTIEGCVFAGPCSIDPAAPLGTDHSEIGEYDATAGTPATSARPATGDIWVDIHVSRDGNRVYASGFTVNPVTPQGTVSVFDPAGWLLLGQRTTLVPAFETVDSVSRQRSFTNTGRVVEVLDFAESPAGSIPVAPTHMSVSADETRLWAASLTTVGLRNFTGLPNRLEGVDLATNTVVTTTLLTGQPTGIAATPPGANACNYQVDTKQSSWMREGGTAPIVLRTACAWAAESDASWARLSAASGSGDATLTLTVDPNPTINTRTATLSIGGRLVTVTQAGPFTQPAFVFIDSPADNTTGISGAMSVTGWALDDVGVARVSIFRDPVAGEPNAPIFIGNATFVDGARPDVQAVFPSLPGASRAGWGLQILTNGLPEGGNGTYRLLVFAEDTEGHTTLLGTRTFTANNATATIPFGNIDTPSSGQTVSGTIVNFGWALTPQPAFIPSGSTIDVLVDGVVVGHPTYGFARSDIDTFFPGFMNSGAAVGFFMLDTTTLTNGLHTIAWVVHDNLGGTQGIGSRVFFVDNP